MSNPLELLAPAKNADIGIEAIKHGADAVYIGGPAFGARYGAGNNPADIERLASFSHRFHAKVFVALNTILTDAEIEPARQLAWQMYEAGADALILQDMGLLQVDLPPIQLHASTQTDIRTPEKARFLSEVGFSQIVLARELSLDEIRTIHARVGDGIDAASGQAAVGSSLAPILEYFVHGALCVAFSGQCNISYAHTGRSANRGECSQACRLPYTLEDKQGRIVAHEKHLLSMKDNDQSANLRALADAVHAVGGMFVLDCIASGAMWVDMAATGVDILISAPQKGWSASPCCGLVMLNKTARERIEATTSTSFAADLKKWLQIMETYEQGGHAYHATMPTDGLRALRDAMREAEAVGFEPLRAAQMRLGQRVRQLLEARGYPSVAAAGFQAPGVVVSYTTDDGIKTGQKFSALGLQTAAGVPLQCDEPADFKTFRLGLFGLDKLADIERTVGSLEKALQSIG